MAAFAIVAFVMMACSDATAPGSSVTVQVTVSQLHGPTLGMVNDTVPSVSCDADVRAVAKGAGQATWLDADVRMYGGIDGAQLFDSTTYSSADIQSWWGSSAISPSAGQTMRWTFWATVPFKAVVTYHYREGSGHQDTTSVTIDCGPQVPTGTAAPSLTVVSVQPDTGATEPGDTLSVTYTASSTVGIWETIVQLSGPCDVRRIIPDSLQKNVTRTVRIALPQTCALGRSITAVVGTWDAGRQLSVRELDTHITLVDVTPPTIAPEGLASNSDYFAGDSIRVRPMAYDNHALRMVGWEFMPAGVTDSVITTNQVLDDWISIPIPSSVTGRQQLRFYARDAVGLTSDTVSVPQDGSFSVHGTLQLPVTSTTADGEIRDVAIDTRRGLVYLLQSNHARVVSLSLPSLAAVRVDTFPTIPTTFDLTPSGDSLVVLLARMGALCIVDLTQPSHPQSIIPLTGFDTTASRMSTPPMRVTANGRVFVSLSSSTSNMSQLLEVNLATGTQRIRTDAGDGGIIGSGNMVESLDHSVVLLTGGATYYQRYDSGTDTFGPRTTATPSDGDVSLDATGDRLAMGLNVYDGSASYLRTVGSPGTPGATPATTISAAGDIVYEIWWPYVVRTRVSDGAILDRIPNPIRPNYMRVSADGTLLVTVESDWGTLQTTKISVITLP